MKTQAFILRFWREAGGGHVTEWRGVIIHVESGERIPVRSLEEATQIVASYLASDTPPDPSYHQGDE